MVTEDTGQVFEGYSVQFLDLIPADNGNFKGLEWSKLTAPLSMLPEFKSVPGLYEIDLKAKPGGKVAIRTLKFKSGVSFTPTK
jgi:hypothetical protein